MRLFLISIFQLYFLFAFSQDFTSVNIDLGGNNSNFPWNNLMNSNNGSLQNLFDENGIQTEINIDVIDSFNGTNNTGTTSAATNLDFPSSASADSFFGNTEEFAGNIDPTGAVILFGLDESKQYDLSLFASRLANNNRETQYIVISSEIDTLYLDVSDNTDLVAKLNGLSPRTGGTIEIQCTKGPNNDSDFGFFYLGIIRLEFESDQDPIEPSLELTSPNGGEYWQPGKSPEIRWKSQGISNALLEYSINGGANWETITNTSAVTQSYNWTIPNLPTNDCMVRISSDTLSSQSDNVFEIPSEDSLNCHIVVLGSSTAAGAGPTSLDSAWVWMYRDFLFQRDTRFQITNLAQGGFTTYNILPTGTPIPPVILQSVNEEKNVSMALSLSPDAIIINLPSNDAAALYSIEDQLNNYDLILAPLDDEEIPYWICTPQPRNGFNDTQVQIQEDLRDSTFMRFEEFAIDFWTELATQEGFINPLYNSGDGVHLNNEGHNILLERVIEKNVNTFLLEDKDLLNSVQNFNELAPLKLFPNPSSGQVSVGVDPPFDFSLYNKQGQLVQSIQDHQEKTMSIDQQGLLYLIVFKDGKNYGTTLIIQ